DGPVLGRLPHPGTAAHAPAGRDLLVLMRPQAALARALLAACLLGGAVHAGAGTAPPLLAAGAAVGGTVAAGEVRSYRLDVPAGHVVQGSFDGQGARLDLQDAAG